jgi:hypothetical protein
VLASDPRVRIDQSAALLPRHSVAAVGSIPSRV